MEPSTAKISFFQIILTVVGLFCLFYSIPMPCMASLSNNFSPIKRTIILDPGHGGDDIGAKGENGTLEKDLTLALAKAMADRLQPRYQVLLTRNDDHHISLSDRTALANHHKADLFISLHLGGSFKPETNAYLITYYVPPNMNNNEWNNNIGELSNSEDMAPDLWRNLQLEHISTSRQMAESLRKKLLNQNNSPHPIVNKAPLYVLEGAIMPALCIEPFYITHPASEAQYRDPRELDKLARELALGISTIIDN